MFYSSFPQRPARLGRLVFAVALTACCVAPAALGQRHSLGSSPPTAPPPAAVAPAPAPILPVSSGLGPLQFVAVDYSVPAPQALTRQLDSDDDRIRAAALAAIGAPGQYLTRGHIPYPHSIRLDFVALGTSDELDAIVTAELDQHLVSAILIPEDGNWKRVASILFATNFDDPTTNPSTFLRTDRALLQHNRYRAIFHGSVSSPNGDFVQNEAHLEVINNRAVVTVSFVSDSRACGGPGPARRAHNDCDLVRRWLQPDTTEPQHFVLVTGSGHTSPHDDPEAIASSRAVELSHLRFFSCQPFAFSTSTSRFEPTAVVVPCSAYEAAPSPARP